MADCLVHEAVDVFFGIFGVILRGARVGLTMIICAVGFVFGVYVCEGDYFVAVADAMEDRVERVFAAGDQGDYV